MRMRIYDVGRTASGKRVVMSGGLGEWWIFGAIKWICKAIFFCMFFWIIIPVKLLKR